MHLTYVRCGLCVLIVSGPIKTALVTKRQLPDSHSLYLPSINLTIDEWNKEMDLNLSEVLVSMAGKQCTCQAAPDGSYSCPMHESRLPMQKLYNSICYQFSIDFNRRFPWHLCCLTSDLWENLSLLLTFLSFSKSSQILPSVEHKLWLLGSTELQQKWYWALLALQRSFKGPMTALQENIKIASTQS